MHWRSYLLAAVSGALMTLAFPPFECWPLAWVALVPLLRAAMAAPDIRSAANLAAVTGLVFYGSSLHWLSKVFGPFVIAFWSLFALWLALHTALLWRLQGRLGAGAWTICAGVLWTAIEYFRAEIWWLHNSWLSFGYSQVPSGPLLQSVSLWGVYGLSGLVGASNAAIYAALDRRWKPLACVAAVTAVLALWGARRQNDFPLDAGRPVRVALVQDENFDLDRLAALSFSPEAKDAELLVWPEYGFTIQPGREKSYADLLARKLAASKAVKVLGAAIFPGDPKEGKMQNFAWVLGPDGALLGRYDKFHPIPFVEKSLPPNPDPRPVDTPLGRVGVQICYDLDFADGVRRLANLGANILVVPNMDPLDWKDWQHRQHSAMSPARAVESGLWIARAASSGYSQIIDPLGKVRASLSPAHTGVLTGTARLREPGTFYSRIGWLWDPLCLLAGLGLTSWALLGRREAARSAAGSPAPSST